MGSGRGPLRRHNLLGQQWTSGLTGGHMQGQWDDAALNANFVSFQAPTMPAETSILTFAGRGSFLFPSPISILLHAFHCLGPVQRRSQR